jgi:hypothetical protein
MSEGGAPMVRPMLRRVRLALAALLEQR